MKNSYKSEKFRHYAKEAGIVAISLLLGFIIWIFLSNTPPLSLI